MTDPVQEQTLVDAAIPTAVSPASDENDSTLSTTNVETPVAFDDTITESMIEEENKLHEKTTKEEEQKIEKLKEKFLFGAQAASEFNDTVNRQRFQRLNFLIEKSTLYANFLSQKLEKQQNDARAKAAVQEAKREKEREKERDKKESERNAESEATVPSTRSSGRNASKNAPETATATADFKRRGAPSKKRKADEDYKIADYVDSDSLKKQKNEESATQQPLIASTINGTAPIVKPTISARQPSLVTGGILRDYQLAGVEWMVSLYENGLNGILADEMGLGKTLQTISFLSYLREKGVWGPFLIVAPLSTLANWINEFERFTPTVPCVLYHGQPEQRTHIRNKRFKKMDPSFPICVTSYEIVMNDRKHLQKYQWKYIIVDEGHRLKNMNCKLIRELKSYHSANRLLLTGTPLQNNLSELWSLLNFLLPDIFDDLEMEHSLPKKREYLLYAPLTPVQKEWYEAVTSRGLRNYLIEKKSGFEGAADTDSKVPGSVESESVDGSEDMPEDEIEAVLEEEEASEKKAEETSIARRRKQRGSAVTSYEEKSDSKYFKELESSVTSKLEELKAANTKAAARAVDIKRASKTVSNMKLLNVAMQLRKVCNHPFLFDWPIDRRTNLPVVSEELLNSSGKMLVLNRILPPLFERGHKVLIFSQFTTMLDIIEDWAENYKSWPCCRIDGTVKQDDRRRQIAEFNSSPQLKLFLLSTRAGGLGINLTSADTVIIFDSDWNPQMDLQAQDRVHRIGQTKPVMIYRLVTANTFESKIIERAASKRKLEKLVIHKGKFKQPPSATTPGFDRKSSLVDLAEILAQDDGEKFQVATKDDVVISDEHLEMLLDRSAAAYANANCSSSFKAVEEERNDQNDILKVDKMTASS
ncbi:hypothetical protein BG004_006931 [Podila humilis]|nr:hypothetical protein BG004_006931 [Podila humilis]